MTLTIVSLHRKLGNILITLDPFRNVFNGSAMEICKTMILHKSIFLPSGQQQNSNRRKHKLNNRTKQRTNSVPSLANNSNASNKLCRHT